MGENQLVKKKKSKKEKILQVQAITSIIQQGRDFIWSKHTRRTWKHGERKEFAQCFTESSIYQLLNAFISSHCFLGL